jgi:hypothetical protein
LKGVVGGVANELSAVPGDGGLRSALVRVSVWRNVRSGFSMGWNGYYGRLAG